jgi:SAM-dependent methyltransferase
MSGPATACPACLAQDFRLDFSAGTAEIWRCPVCGLGATVPQPAEANGHEAFREDRGYFASALQETKDSAWQCFTTEPFNLLAKVGAGPGDRLLELGCGVGVFVQLAKSRGFDAFGIDSSPAAVAVGREQLGVNLVRERIETAAVDPRSVDIVVAHHVLEHLTEPEEVLRRVREWLRPGGWVLVGVPNFASPIARWSGQCWAGLVPTQHLWHFTPPALQRLIARSGFGRMLWRTRMLVCRPTSASDWMKWGIRRFLEPLGLADNLLLVAQRPF